MAPLWRCFLPFVVPLTAHRRPHLPQIARPKSICNKSTRSCSPRLHVRLAWALLTAPHRSIQPKTSVALNPTTSTGKAGQPGTSRASTHRGNSRSVCIGMLQLLLSSAPRRDRRRGPLLRCGRESMQPNSASNHDSAFSNSAPSCSAPLASFLWLLVSLCLWIKTSCSVSKPRYSLKNKFLLYGSTVWSVFPRSRLHVSYHVYICFPQASIRMLHSSILSSRHRLLPSHMLLLCIIFPSCNA
jgi:hypothetical protein